MSNRRDIPGEASEALRVVQGALGQSVVAAYLFGSAVAGGLRTASDVDVLVVVDRALSKRVRGRLVEDLMPVSGRIGNDEGRRPLELTIVYRADVVPWRYPPKAQLVYGEWLREEFESGRVSGPGADPDLAIVLKQVRDYSIPLVGRAASMTLEPVPLVDVRRAMQDSLPCLIDGIQGDERNVLLTLARMWLTASEGEIAPKDVAAAWAVARLDDDHAPLLELAKKGYLGEVEDFWPGKDVELEGLVSTMRQAIEACLTRESWKKPQSRSVVYGKH
jgi:aminoglycoside 9-adenylyltransferase